MRVRSRLKVRVETCKRKNGSTRESDIGQTREQVWSSDGQTETTGRAVEVRKRQRHSAGHRELKAANSRGGQRLGERVGGLVGGGDVDEAERAPVDDFVA